NTQSKIRSSWKERTPNRLPCTGPASAGFRPVRSLRSLEIYRPPKSASTSCVSGRRWSRIPIGQSVSPFPELKNRIVHFFPYEGKNRRCVFRPCGKKRTVRFLPKWQETDGAFFARVGEKWTV